jgi:asparagine synthase (glutamine-hydrolysing)
VKAIEASAQATDRDVLGTWVGRLRPDALEVVQEPRGVSSATTRRLTVLFDGVLYNRADLRGALPEARDDDDDARLVLRAYERWGRDALNRIKGIYAVAIRDGDERSALLARDPLGTYPLFYADRGDELLLSTSIEALLGCDGVSPALNRAALADHICHRWPDREETYFESVRRVPACHALLLERGTRRLLRYWDPAPPGEEMKWVAEDELGRFRDLFDEAVNRCVGTGGSGIFLSGGLDSVSVAGVALDNCRARGLPEPLALSVVFPDPECNEELAQRAVARGLGLEQIVLNLDDAVAPHGLLQATAALQADRPAPLLNYYAPPYLHLTKEAKARGCDVILTGTGGDEWLCVTPLLAADLIRAGDFRGLVKHVKSMQRSFNLPARTVWGRALWEHGTRHLLASAVGYSLRRVAPGLHRSYRRRVVNKGIPHWVAPDPALKSDLETRNIEAWPDRPTDGWYRHDIRIGLDHPVASMELEEFFENTRLTGVRTASPFLDADLVDFLYRVPPDLLDRGGRSKGLVRDELARRFPDLGFERHKKITAISYSRNLVMQEGARAWRASGGVPALAELEVIDRSAFEQEMEAILSGREEDTFHIWDILNLEAWVRTRI